MESSAKSRSNESALLRDRIAWIPAFLVGFSAAVAGELAAGLLLYSGSGFLRALTTVLATETAALGAGFVLSGAIGGSNLDAMRRRWLFAVVSFGVAALFAGAWGLTGGFAASPVYQGLGLGLLAALPLFSAGAVLGGIAALPGPTVAAPASFGATSGLLLAGVYGIAAVQPASLLLLSVVLLSGGALQHGWLLDGRVLVRVRDDGVEEWRRVRPHLRMEVLTLDGSPADARLDRSGSEAVVVPWQCQVLDSVRREWRGDSGILLVGAGLGALVSGLKEVASGANVVIVDPLDGDPLADQDPRSDPERISEPELEGPTEWPGNRFGSVVVNTRLLPKRGPLGGPDLELLDRVIATWDGAGLLYLGGLPEEGLPGKDGGAVEETVEWLGRRTSAEFHYFGSDAGPGDDRSGLLNGSGGLLVCRRDGAGGRP